MSEITQLDLNGVNCYLIRGTKGFVLVDTGGYTFSDKKITNRKDKLIEELDKNQCDSDNLSLIVLTHGDIDHVANVSYLKNKFNVHVLMHKNDYELVTKLSIEKIFHNFRFNSFILNIIARIMNPLFTKISKRIVDDYHEFEPDILIEDDYTLSNFGINAKLINVPGHSKGSIVMLFENGDLICGDIFVNVNKPRIALNAYDFKLLKNNIHKLPLDKIKYVYPGHGSPFKMSKLKL